MLTTDKNEIIESICTDLEGASDAALVRLAGTFGVSLQDYSTPILNKSPHTTNIEKTNEVEDSNLLSIQLV
ncbi:MAG: hypothetical protein LBU85_11625 [Treponema sp.]|jgi:hypothetical protein|nr:hypothetical protein [Treponema sp.]